MLGTLEILSKYKTKQTLYICSDIFARLWPAILVLSPTREAAIQIFQAILEWLLLNPRGLCISPKIADCSWARSCLLKACWGQWRPFPANYAAATALNHSHAAKTFRITAKYISEPRGRNSGPPESKTPTPRTYLQTICVKNSFNQALNSIPWTNLHQLRIFANTILLISALHGKENLRDMMKQLKG